ncbi:MAG: Hsp70 family protein [Leptospiraceae bacterium]|nr:Hsp70 family protein [Leptospiraceae bacterium]
MGNKSARFPTFQLSENGSRTFGKTAMVDFENIYKEDKGKLGNSVNVYYEYKRNLGSDPQAIDLTAEILKYIIHTVQTEKSAQVDEVVVTVPLEEADLKQKATKEAVKKSGTQLNRIIREPVAAAAYYAYIRNDKKQENILICDLGGGTQDYLLCKIDSKNNIEFLDSSYSDKSGGGYIDDEIAKKLANQAGKDFESLYEYDKTYLKIRSEILKIKANDEVRLKNDDLKNASELKKNFLSRLKDTLKETKDTVKQKLSKYVGGFFKGIKEEFVFFFNKDVSFFPQEIPDITNRFGEVVENKIKDLLNKNINIKIDRVVLVGGSSNNILLYSHISENINSDFYEFANEDDKTMAISYGASLIAYNKIHIKEKISLNFGLWVVAKKGVEKVFPLLSKNNFVGEKVVSSKALKAKNNGANRISVVSWNENVEEPKEIGTVEFSISSEVKKVYFSLTVLNENKLMIECLDQKKQLIGNYELVYSE